MGYVQIACGRPGDTPTFVQVECEFVGRNLAVHRPHNLGTDPNPPGWNVTHVPSGRAVIAGIKRRADAVRVAEKMRKHARKCRLSLSLADEASLMRARGWGEWAKLGAALRKKIEMI